MKSFKEFLEEQKQIGEATLKTGTKVTVKNAKSYDAFSKKNEVEGIVQGMMNKNTVMVKVGSGQMNVDLKDIVESVQIDEMLVNNHTNPKFAEVFADNIDRGGRPLVDSSGKELPNSIVINDDMYMIKLGSQFHIFVRGDYSAKNTSEVTIDPAAARIIKRFL